MSSTEQVAKKSVLICEICGTLFKDRTGPKSVGYTMKTVGTPYYNMIIEEIHGKKMEKSFGNSVFIVIFANDFTKNLYSKKRNRKKNKLHTKSYGEKYIQR